MLLISLTSPTQRGTPISLSPAGIRPSDRVPVRTASLFLLGQPGFGKFVNHVVGALLCRLSLRFWRCGDFRILCNAHRYFSFMA
jgi:hypothetical protein